MHAMQTNVADLELLEVSHDDEGGAQSADTPAGQPRPEASLHTQKYDVIHRHTKKDKEQ